MTSEAPNAFVIGHDDYHAEYAGRLADGRQFFLTTPFLPAMDGPDSGSEFIALYVFDARGKLEEATVEDFGPRAHLDCEKEQARRDELLAQLGKLTFGDITIAPFSVSRFGTDFGFIAQPPEDDDRKWCVTVEPGDYMCFWPPWDTGVYDT